MKRLAGVALVVLAACGGSGETPDEALTPEELEAEAYGLPVEEYRYVTFVRERVPGATDRSDAELIAGGKALCVELEGKTVDDLAILAVTLGYEMQEFADVLTASINTFCPEYDHLLG